MACTVESVADRVKLLQDFVIDLLQPSFRLWHGHPDHGRGREMNLANDLANRGTQLRSPPFHVGRRGVVPAYDGESQFKALVPEQEIPRLELGRGEGIVINPASRLEKCPRRRHVMPTVGTGRVSGRFSSFIARWIVPRETPRRSASPTWVLANALASGRPPLWTACNRLTSPVDSGCRLGTHSPNLAPEGMRISYTNTFTDLLAFHLHHLSRSRGLIALNLGCVAFLAYGFFRQTVPDAAHSWGLTTRVVATAVFAGVFWVILIALQFAIVALHLAWRGRGTKAPLCTLILDDDGFVEETTTARLQYKWAAVRKLDGTRRHLFLYVAQGAAVLVPRRAVRDQAEWNALREMCQRMAVTGVTALVASPDRGQVDREHSRDG